MRTWYQVTRQEPCAICGHIDWCATSVDGTWAICRRVDNGTGQHRVDKAGADYWLHRLLERSRPRPTPPPSQPRAICADPLTLDQVYSSLLAVLPLSTTHRQELRQRGLDDREILRRRYRTLPLRSRADLAKRLVAQFGAELCAQVPGLYQAAGEGRQWWSLAGAAGLLIPVRDVDGHLIALKVRTDDPGEGPKYTTISSVKHGGPGPGAPIHVPLHNIPRGDTVRVSEGELKADIASALSGVLTLSIPGVTAWRTVLPVLEILQAHRVWLAFDMDWGTNAHVARALAQTAEALVEAGYDVMVETWDVAQGKGIDDVLAAGYTPALRSAVPWLHKARTFPEKSGRGPSHLVVEVR